MTGYLSVLMLGFAGAVISLSIIFLVALIGPKRPNKYKMSVIECGVPPSGDARKRFSVRFYLVALSFLLFDVEVALLFPWALSYRKFLDTSGLAILFVGLFFLTMITVAFVYEWRRGGLEWE
ncbi:MAG: NADH-quinone oxidoreductase subunit A [Bdellovibrionales bacterium]|nr:NADH-quinone oxidoreductase subunit A [Bdellovibrionales bacterium]